MKMQQEKEEMLQYRTRVTEQMRTLEIVWRPH